MFSGTDHFGFLLKCRHILGIIFYTIFLRRSISFIKNNHLSYIYHKNGRHSVVEWLKHYATSWKAAGSTLDEVNECFNLPNPFQGLVQREGLGKSFPLH
jgi:hypothetical protein